MTLVPPVGVSEDDAAARSIVFPKVDATCTAYVFLCMIQKILHVVGINLADLEPRYNVCDYKFIN